MLVKVLKGKLHRATVTDATVNYVGSITIDADLLDQAGIAEFEAVLVANLNNGSRHETYVMAGERGGGHVICNGAAARLAQPGDKIIVFSFGYINADEVGAHRPTILLIHEDGNRVEQTLK